MMRYIDSFEVEAVQSLFLETFFVEKREGRIDFWFNEDFKKDIVEMVPEVMHVSMAKYQVFELAECMRDIDIRRKAKSPYWFTINLFVGVIRHLLALQSYEESSMLRTGMLFYIKNGNGRKLTVMTRLHTKLDGSKELNFFCMPFNGLPGSWPSRNFVVIPQ